MTCNVGGIERAVRLVLGLALLGIGILSDLPFAGMVVVLVVSVILLLTGLVGFCPAWSLFGINTCPTKPTGKT
jgi:DUF2892 family protein